MPIGVKNIVFGGAHDQFGFRAVHELFGKSVVEIRTGFYFHKNRQLAFFGNNVNF